MRQWRLSQFQPRQARDNQLYLILSYNIIEIIFEVIVLDCVLIIRDIFFFFPEQNKQNSP